MLYRLLFFTILFFVQKSLFAEASFRPHLGESPWSFTVISEPSDTFVVNDTDSATIDQVLFSEDGSIYIDVPIRRYVGKTDTEGYLLNVDALIANGIVSKTASIVMPVYDIDDEPYINDWYDCDGDNIVDDMLVHEVDEVFLNGEKIGILKGDSLVWTINRFDVDISKIKFPTAPGETAINQFRVDIDVVNAGVVLSSGAVGCGSGWSTSVDWVGIKYEAASPLILIHGIKPPLLGTSPASEIFANFIVGLDKYHVVSDASINLTDLVAPDPLEVGCPDTPYNRSIDHNVAQLQQLIPAISELYGTDSVHLVAHSKGGLDVRGFLMSLYGTTVETSLGIMGGQPVKRDLDVLSLITLNTPHAGSVLAKYGVEARQLTYLQAIISGIDTLLPAKALEGSYYCDLTPARASAFTASGILPGTIETASIATDADRNGDQVLTDNETLNLPLANKLYQLVGGTAYVSITVIPGTFMDEVVVNPVDTTLFQPNDGIVTQRSAGLYQIYDVTGSNHVNVHSTENAEIIATDALQESGLVHWRLR